MVLTFVLGWIVMLVPAGSAACAWSGRGVYFAWWMATVYVIALGLLMWRRFRAGHWKALRVIETARARPRRASRRGLTDR